MSEEYTVDVRHFGDVLTRVAAYDKRLSASLRREIRKAGTEAVKDVQRTVKQPTPGGKSRATGRDARGRFSSVSVRSKLAANTKLSIQNSRAGVGVRIRTGSSGMGDSAAMVRLYNLRSWRHPVYGNTEKWVTQQGRPYFGSVILKHRNDMLRGVERALDDALEAMK